MKTAVREQVDTSILDTITVAPAPGVDRYAGVAVDRYASAAVDRYASVDRFGGVDWYAAPPPAAVPKPDRYRRKDRYAAGNKRHPIRRTIMVIPPLRTEGRLLWVPVQAYVERMDDCGNCRVPLWERGELIDFTEAADVTTWRWGSDEPEPIDAVTVANEAETFVDDGWRPECDAWPALIDQALAFRAEIAKDPELVVENLDRGDLASVAVRAGMGGMPMPREVIEAIHDDRARGLGGAALDYAVWELASRFGPTGAELADALNHLEEEVNEGPVRLLPSENFLLYTGPLPADTVGVAHPNPYHPNDVLYPMLGTWAISKVSYTSDLTGKVVGGWRSLWLEPHRADGTSVA
jgi:hypothetical protein